MEITSSLKDILISILNSFIYIAVTVSRSYCQNGMP